MSISRNMGLTPGRPPVVGGTTLAVTQSSIIIGSIGGLLLRCSASTWRNEDNTAQSSSTLRFEQDATEILHQLHPQAQKKLIRHLEIWAASGRKKYINARDIFTSKPNFDLIFPSFEAITEFEPHVGPITAIATSPFHRNLFLTVGVDGSFKLRSALQSPALSYSTGVINGVGRDCAPVPLYAADWSKARPLVFAVAGDEGVVQIYDLRAQSTRPVAELKLPGETPRVLSIEFNPKMREFIACGDSSGHVHLWQLSWGLSNPVPLEHEILQAYAESDTLIH